MTFAARAGVLQYLMNGANDDSTYLLRRRRTALPSRPRFVAGVKPGSTALKRSRRVWRANASTVASSHCFDVA